MSTRPAVGLTIDLTLAHSVTLSDDWGGLVGIEPTTPAWGAGRTNARLPQLRARKNFCASSRNLRAVLPKAARMEGLVCLFASCSACTLATHAAWTASKVHLACAAQAGLIRSN